MNDAIINWLQQITKFEETQRYGFTRKEFEENSYAIYTVYEIMNDILEHPMVPADETIDKFRYRMWLYSQKAPGYKTRRIFEIAANTADTILAMM